MRPFFVLALALVALPAAVRAQIYTTTGAMPVRIELVTICTVAVADLYFGDYLSNSAAPVLGQTTISLHCAAGETAEIGLDAGSGVGASTSNRRMEAMQGRGRISYGLFQDPGRTMVWGDRSGRDTLEVQTTGELQSIPIYGQIPAGQRELEGVYSDTITLRVMY